MFDNMNENQWKINVISICKQISKNFRFLREQMSRIGLQTKWPGQHLRKHFNIYSTCNY